MSKLSDGSAREPVTALLRSWSATTTSFVREQWIRHGRILLIAGAVYMGITCFLRLRYAFLALTSIPEEAIDLQNRYAEVQRWFAGLPVYGSIESADYPPASYLLLWPLLGWLPFASTRWLWAAGAVVVLGSLVYLVVRESTARTRPERLFMALLVLPMYATQLTIWIGQLGLHVLLPMVAALVWLYQSRGRWLEDLLAAVLLVLALVKPTLSVPFFWIVLFIPGRLRPFVLVLVGYGALSLIAATFQEAGLPTLMSEWLSQGSMLKLHSGTVNVHKWLATVGLDAWLLPASASILALLGVWTFRHRRADLWVLVGVAALASRVWIHHRAYDDVLILLPMIALFRLAKAGPSAGGTDVTAGLLFAAMWTTTLMPYWVFFEGAPQVLAWLVKAGLTVVWLTVLTFLLYMAPRTTRSPAEL